MLDVVILAAGKGTRMKSTLPKVLHPIAGKPMLRHVLETAQSIGGHLNVTTVIGHGSEEILKQFESSETTFVYQYEQLGTGHAVKMALPKLNDNGVVLILYGDVPLIQKETLQQLIEKVSSHTMGLLTITLSNATGYGRIVRDVDNNVVAIVEQKDATPEQLKIKEINTGVMALTTQHIQNWLPKLSNDNAQGEYYLTDIIAMAKAEDVEVQTVHPQSEIEVLGVNNRSQQAQLERHYQKIKADQLMADGVTLMDPNRFDCRGTITVGNDVSVDVNCIFEGAVELGSNVIIGANCIIINSKIASGTVIKPNSVIEEALIGEDCDIGPFARVRPGTQLAKGARLGNFVETKKAIIGEGSKVNHLTYIGDTDIGSNVNVGAGTITCNYDGVNKSKTTIKDNAFIGSNSSLVAPVIIGQGATVGAGSTVSADVPDENLSVARAKQRNISGWKRPTKK